MQLAKLHPEINKEKMLDELLTNQTNVIIKEQKKKITLKKIVYNGEEYYISNDNFIINKKAEKIGYKRKNELIFYFKNNIDLKKNQYKLGE